MRRLHVGRTSRQRRSNSETSPVSIVEEALPQDALKRMVRSSGMREHDHHTSAKTKSGQFLLPEVQRYYPSNRKGWEQTAFHVRSESGNSSRTLAGVVCSFAKLPQVLHHPQKESVRQEESSWRALTGLRHHNRVGNSSKVLQQPSATLSVPSSSITVSSARGIAGATRQVRHDPAARHGVAETLLHSPVIRSLFSCSGSVPLSREVEQAIAGGGRQSKDQRLVNRLVPTQYSPAILSFSSRSSSTMAVVREVEQGSAGGGGGGGNYELRQQVEVGGSERQWDVGFIDCFIHEPYFILRLEMKINSR